MSHPLLKTAIRLFCTSILLLAFADIASACVCPGPPTVLAAYEKADAVMIVRLLSYERVDASDPNRPVPLGNLRRAVVSVERVYKGTAKVNDPLTFGQGVLLKCAWPLDETAIGSEFLLYATAPQTEFGVWGLAFCGRSKLLSEATEDLLYLDNMKTLRGKTRVSGKYSGWSNQDFIVAQRSIRIVGDKKTYEVFTDENGVYEIYDLPPGEYRVEPEMPEGWRMDRYWVQWSSSAVARFTSPKTVQFVLEPNKHVSINLPFKPDNSVEGTIVGPKGEPLVKTCAYLRRPDQITNDMLGSTARDCTDANGRFRIESVAPGTYVLLLNLDGIPKTSEPFPRTFYPGTTDQQKATSITIGLGQKIKDVNVKVPVLLETITVHGVLYYSDGQPAPKRTVRFEPVEERDLIGFTAVDTDELGRFSLTLLKGLPGKIESAIAIARETQHNCPEWDALTKQTSETYLHARTQETRIEADQDLMNLVLRLPIPSCEPNGPK